MANKFQNPWDVGGEHYNQNALHTEFLPKDAAYFTGINPNTGEQAGASSNNSITKCGNEYITVTNKNKDNISSVSWGETSGLYPVKNGNLKYSDMINIDNWDCDILKQLMKARAGITLVADRNGKHHTAKLNLNNAVEKNLLHFI